MIVWRYFMSKYCPKNDEDLKKCPNLGVTPEGYSMFEWQCWYWCLFLLFRSHLFSIFHNKKHKCAQTYKYKNKDHEVACIGSVILHESLLVGIQLTNK